MKVLSVYTLLNVFADAFSVICECSKLATKDKIQLLKIKKEHDAIRTVCQEAIKQYTEKNQLVIEGEETIDAYGMKVSKSCFAAFNTFMNEVMNTVHEVNLDPIQITETIFDELSAINVIRLLEMGVLKKPETPFELTEAQLAKLSVKDMDFLSNTEVILL